MKQRITIITGSSWHQQRQRRPDNAEPSGKVKAQGVYSIRLKPITFSKIPREALSPYPQ